MVSAKALCDFGLVWKDSWIFCNVFIALCREFTTLNEIEDLLVTGNGASTIGLVYETRCCAFQCPALFLAVLMLNRHGLAKLQ